MRWLKVYVDAAIFQIVVLDSVVLFGIHRSVRKSKVQKDGSIMATERGGSNEFERSFDMGYRM